ncbi:MAG: hypothetical protein NTX53_07525 [candidate division WOR-3 bacterium]|nr:hypothetical protein [candidate division WOR-3 bacterium]
MYLTIGKVKVKAKVEAEATRSASQSAKCPEAESGTKPTDEYRARKAKGKSQISKVKTADGTGEVRSEKLEARSQKSAGSRQETVHRAGGRFQILDCRSQEFGTLAVISQFLSEPSVLQAYRIVVF